MNRERKSERGLIHQTIRKTVANAIDHGVGKSAAALTYYLLFALFPLMIFVSNLLGLLDLDVTSITRALLPIMPDDVVYLLEAYLSHVTDSSSKTLFWFSLVFTVWFPMRAVRGLMDDVRLAYQLGRPAKPIAYALKQFVFTVVFFAFIVVLAVLAILGRRVISSLTRWLGLDKLIVIPAFFLNSWQYVRFLFLAVIMFTVVGMLYAVAQDSRQKMKMILPGVILAMIVWLLVSIGFSMYVEQYSNYSAIYGTLGGVIALLIWLYMTSFVLILGAEFNAAIISVKESRTGAVK